MWHVLGKGKKAQFHFASVKIAESLGNGKRTHHQKYKTLEDVQNSLAFDDSFKSRFPFN